jgi:hypothetical protein
MWNSHSSAGLAQTIFYIPAIIAAAFLLFRKRQERPLIQWVVLQIFSIVRFASGIVLMLYVSHSSEVGYIIAAIILEGAGVIPLLVSLMLHIRVV